MPDVVGRFRGWWKAAAGCAICASLVAGIINDTRTWIWDRTVGFIWPAQASFDTCLSRQLDGLKRPEGALYQVIVTVPLGDPDQTAFRTIETSLTRAYGETSAATIRVGALDCEPLRPTSGDSAARLAVAEARADALLAATGADAVLWGEVFGDGKTMELRFAHPAEPEAATADRAAVYAAGTITLDLNFGNDIGALLAARALDRTTAVSGGFSLDQGAVAAQIQALLGPLVAARPAGISDADYATVLLSEGLAAGTAAAAAGAAAALIAVADRLGTAESLFPEDDARMRDFARIAAAFYRGSAASLLPADQALAALTRATDEFKAVSPRIADLMGPEAAVALESDLGLAMTLAASLMPEPDRSRWMGDGISRLRAASVALPDPGMLLQFALGTSARMAMAEGAEEAALIVEATAAVDRALAGLSQDDRGLIWLRAMTLKGSLLLSSAQALNDPDPAATLDEAAAILTEAVDAARNSAATVDRAKAEATLGWVLVLRGSMAREAGEAAALLDRAETSLRGALDVYGPTSSPLLWAWTLDGLAFASAACLRAPDCADPGGKSAEASARFAESAEAYRVAGHEQLYARSMALSQKYATAP
jgi:hypothetical protein